MKYIVTTSKTVDQAAEDLKAAVLANKFGVLHIHNLKETMNKKGVAFENDCRIFEVCNPHKAKSVLSSDMSLNMALPCRISIWQEKNAVMIGTLLPTQLLSTLSDDPDLVPIAREVEQTIKTIIEQTV